jgi:hypothetical protein
MLQLKIHGMCHTIVRAVATSEINDAMYKMCPSDDSTGKREFGKLWLM